MLLVGIVDATECGRGGKVDATDSAHRERDLALQTTLEVLDAVLGVVVDPRYLSSCQRFKR
jgi:hypothetical protein